MKKLSIILLTSVGSAIVACGTGSSNSTSINYYSASNSSYYSIESGLNVLNESQLYINMVTQHGTWQAPLTQSSSNNSYTFNSNNISGTVTLSDSNLGISYNSTSENWIDFATIESNVIATVPNGTYNLICDQSNLSACSMVINNNNITVTEYSTTWQATTLCNTQLVQSDNNKINPYLYSFNCGVNGGSASGQWNIMPFTINNTTAIMVAEFNVAENINDDSTDEIAFPNMSIHPIGTYNYLYNGGSFQGTGVSTAQFTVSGVTNSTVGTCSGSACALIVNQYYNANTATGFDWYNVNSLNNYNLTGSDAMKIYQDSFVGFYF